jgi:hypothetical protein
MKIVNNLEELDSYKKELQEAFNNAPLLLSGKKNWPSIILENGSEYYDFGMIGITFLQVKL